MATKAINTVIYALTGKRPHINTDIKFSLQELAGAAIWANNWGNLPLCVEDTESIRIKTVFNPHGHFSKASYVS